MRLTTGFILVMTAGLIGCGGGGGSGGANVIPSASLQGTPTSTVSPDIKTYDYSLGTPSNDTDARAALYDTSLFSLPYTSVYGSPSFSSLSKANADIITDYSLEAGALALDFIVANDDVLATGDAAGTSFAAPRVAGAAALVKQKFPNLNTQQLKQVLLQTATDLGLSGPDSVYGYGKLNINSALSPIGGLSP